MSTTRKWVWRWVVAGCLACSIVEATSAATPPAERNPFAPTRLQIEGRFAAIQAEVDRLRSLGLNSQADAMQAQLTHFQRESVNLEPSNLTDTEFDVVQIYAGVGPSGGSTPPPTGAGTVQLNDTNRPVILSLASFNPVDWRLQLDPGVDLQRIYLIGQYTNRILNPPPGVPIVVQSKMYVGTEPDYVDYPKGQRALNALTGNLPIAAVKGQDYATTTPIVVGPGDPEWLSQRVLREMQQLYTDATAHQRAAEHSAAQEVRFTGLLKYYGQPFSAHTFSNRLAQMSVDGPVNGDSRALPSSFDNFIVSADGSTGYGERSQTVYRVDMATNQVTQLMVSGQGVPELSWPTAVAYDTKRNRLILSSLGGEGYLYAFSPATQQWSLLSSLNNVDLQSITYHAATDSIFGLDIAHGTGQHEIFRYDSAGHQIGAFIVGENIPQMTADWPGMQLMSAGDQLALLTPPTPDLYRLDLPDAYRVFLINPTNGSVSYFGVFDVPEPTAILTPLVLLMVSRPSKRAREGR